ncbi:hypothetical protein RYX36_000203 [Vicia faba]
MRRRLLIVSVTTFSSSSPSHSLLSQLLYLIFVINNISDACFVSIRFNQHKQQNNIFEEEKERTITYLSENHLARIREDDDDKKTREHRLVPIKIVGNDKDLQKSDGCGEEDEGVKVVIKESTKILEKHDGRFKEINSRERLSESSQGELI